jgi:hypothetical protein
VSLLRALLLDSQALKASGTHATIDIITKSRDALSMPTLTTAPPPISSASWCAYSNAQLSSARWSRDIQYSTHLQGSQSYEQEEYTQRFVGSVVQESVHADEHMHAAMQIWM